MWTRKELKEKAKSRFKLNYWRAVLVSLIMIVVAGGAWSGSSAMGGPAELISTKSTTYTQDETNANTINKENTVVEDAEPEDAGDFGVVDSIGFVIMVIIFVVIFLLIFAILFLVQAFLFNPLIVGCNRFFVNSLHTKAEVKDVCYAYDHNYKNGVKVMFFRDLYTFLWTLLLIIPGIVKSYEYRMIPYLLAEHPDMDRETAFKRSREMMTGNKWKAFVLDISFVLWYLLSVCTCGILSILYVGPYVNTTCAALYVELRDGKDPEEELIEQMIQG